MIACSTVLTIQLALTNHFTTVREATKASYLGSWSASLVPLNDHSFVAFKIRLLALLAVIKPLIKDLEVVTVFQMTTPTLIIKADFLL